MGYYYRIYEKDKNGYIPYVPKNFRPEAEIELVYFDYLTSLMENERVFAYKFKKDKEVRREMNISKITIALKEAKAHFGYKVVFDNPYIKEVLAVENQKFLHIKANEDSDAELDKMTVDANSKPFNDMLSYIFENLQDKEKSEIFLKRVYTNDNTFREDMRRYSVTYLSNEGTNEDLEEALRLAEKVQTDLKKYRYFRTLATGRYEYELKLIETEKKQKEKEELKKAKEELKKKEKEAKELAKKLKKEEAPVKVKKPRRK